MREIIVDLFAGGGGASEGIRAALGRDSDVAINHDLVAIAMHEANHPGTRHLRQNVWEVSPRWATRRRPVGLLWASPDCAHFSKAKGSAPTRDREIRSLAWVVEKWAREVRPRVIILENVEEFKTWGPLDRAGVIIPSQKGATYRAFVRSLRRLGYKVEWRNLRACDYGAPTIRKRLFLIARCDGQPIVWPEPTHGPGRLPYRTVAEIIDWSIPCPSIFERKRPLVENTMRRIAKGIRRYVINAAEPFIVTYYGPKNIVPHIQRQFGCGVGSAADKPIGSITAGGMGKTALVTAFMAQHNTGSVGHSAEKPLSTITHRGTQQQNIVTSNLIKLYGTCRHGQAVTEPMPPVTAGGNHVGEVRAFLTKYNGRGTGQGLKDPVATLTTKDRFGLVTVMIKDEPYIITDIGMRMFTPRELFRAQGFPDSYQIDIEIEGKHITKTDQVRCCGNSVCPPIAQALVADNVSSNQALVADVSAAQF